MVFTIGKVTCRGNYALHNMELGIGGFSYRMRDPGVAISSPQKAFVQCASARKASRELGTIWEGVEGDGEGPFGAV